MDPQQQPQEQNNYPEPAPVPQPTGYTPAPQQPQIQQPTQQPYPNAPAVPQQPVNNGYVPLNGSMPAQNPGVAPGGMAQPADMSNGIPKRTGARLAMGILTFLFFLPALIGVIFAMKAYERDRLRGDVVSAKKHMRLAIIFTVVGVILGILIVIGNISSGGK